LSSIIARTLPEIGADHEHVADAKGAALDKDGRERAAALVELGLDHGTFGRAVGIGLELEDFGLKRNRIEQPSRLVFLSAETSTSWTSPPIASTTISCWSSSSRTFCGLAPGLVDLVDRHDHRHASRLGVVDRLDRLRLQPVVGRHHQDYDVGDVGAARAHLGKGFVARRV
jgi:hypothetical protein